MHQIIVTLGVALLTGVVGLVVGRATAARPGLPGRAASGSPDGATGEAGVTSFVASLTEFGETVAPIWSAQIDTSRQQIDTAVATLTERFAEIVAVLERVVGASTDGSPYGDESLFDASRAQLDGVIGTLNQAVEHKQHTLDGLRGLLEYNDRLRTMTADVGRIAAQTRLLALNASIEAARVGEAGRGFGVVATEVGELAGASARTGRQIEQLVDEVSAAIDGTLATAEQNAAIEDTMVVDANSTVQSVLDDLQGFVGGLQEVSLMVGDMAAQIRSDVSGALVHLQFQDRVDQKLGHVSAGIVAFPRAVAAAVADGAGALVPLDTAALLEEMTSTYTMVEELAVHSGSAADSDAPDHDITFF